MKISCWFNLLQKGWVRLKWPFTLADGGAMSAYGFEFPRGRLSRQRLHAGMSSASPTLVDACA